MKGLVWSPIVLSLFGPDLKPGGRDLLFAGEAGKAKQITQEVKRAQDRQIRGTKALRDFYQTTSRRTRN